MNIRLMDFNLRDKLLFILFGTNNWDLINRYEVINNNDNVRVIEHVFLNTHSNKIDNPQYKLYRLAKEIAESNIVQLQNFSPNLNLFTLDEVKRNTRSCIETYINMNAILNEPLFLSIYNRECRKPYSEENFKEFLKKYNFKEQDVLYYDKKIMKYTYVKPDVKFKAIKKIRNKLKYNNDIYNDFIKDYKLYNNYSHANIYANMDDNPEEDVKKLLEINLYILENSLINYIIWATDVNEYTDYWKLHTDNLTCEINKIKYYIKTGTVLLYTKIPNYTFG